MEKKYIIKAINYGAKSDFEAYWSDDDGWVNKKSATSFTEAESKEYELPVGGEWVENKD